MNNNPFSKQVILDALQSDSLDGHIRDFIATSSIIQHSLLEAERLQLDEISDPKEFALKFLEFALRRWFWVVKGE